jgi:hypothetical protein
MSSKCVNLCAHEDLNFWGEFLTCVTESYQGGSYIRFLLRKYFRDSTGSTSYILPPSKDDKCISRNTNKMQLCNRIYHSQVYWRLNMFREANHSSSGALNCICSLWIFPLSLDNGRSPHGYINKRPKIQFRAPDDERCAARNMLSLQ